MAVGLPEGHAVRSCYIGMNIADRLRLSSDERMSLYYAELVMDAGCTAWSSQLAASIMGDEIAARRELFFYSDMRNPRDILGWLQEYMAAGAPAHKRARRILGFALHGRERMQEGLRNTAEVAGRFAQRLGMPEAVPATIWSVFEQWAGSGGTSGDLIPLTSRIVHATSLLEAFHGAGGRSAAIRLAQGKRGKSFDPSVVDAFLSLSREDGFWEGLEQESIWATVRSMEPQSPYRYIREERLEDVALAFADFADLKSFYSAGHSRRVGNLAERMATRMRLPGEQVVSVRRAGLMHDIGLVAVPSFTLHKPEDQLTSVESESLRLHPYYGERILSKVPGLDPLIPLVGAHHERMDGSGYYRGLSGSQIPLGARIIAVADHFDHLSHETPDHAAFGVEEALSRMSEVAGQEHCPDALAALVQELRADGPAAIPWRKSHRREWPAGLTDREVEVLRLLTRGLSRREMAEQLFVSEHTVRHHLEHIYNKVGVSTRVAATLFAVEHELLN